MASRLSHELRTPIAVVRSSLDNLKATPLPDEARVYIARAQEGLARLTQILTRMTEAARLEQSLVRRRARALRPRAGRRGLRRRLPPRVPERAHRATRRRAEPIVVDGAPDLDRADARQAGRERRRVRRRRRDRRAPRPATDGDVQLAVANDGPPLPDGMAGPPVRVDGVGAAAGESRRAAPGLGLYIVRRRSRIPRRRRRAQAAPARNTVVTWFTIGVIARRDLAGGRSDVELERAAAIRSSADEAKVLARASPRLGPGVLDPFIPSKLGRLEIDGQPVAGRCRCTTSSCTHAHLAPSPWSTERTRMVLLPYRVSATVRPTRQTRHRWPPRTDWRGGPGLCGGESAMTFCSSASRHLRRTHATCESGASGSLAARGDRDNRRDPPDACPSLAPSSRPCAVPRPVQPVHDVRVVRAPEAPAEQPVVDRGADLVGHRAVRVPAAGAGATASASRCCRSRS